jgi:hypothetical protein
MKNPLSIETSAYTHTENALAAYGALPWAEMECAFGAHGQASLGRIQVSFAGRLASLVARNYMGLEMLWRSRCRTPFNCAPSSTLNEVM